MTIQKIGTASTLDIISAIKNLLPSVKNTLPPDFKFGCSETSPSSSVAPFPAFCERRSSPPALLLS